MSRTALLLAASEVMAGTPAEACWRPVPEVAARALSRAGWQGAALALAAQRMPRLLAALERRVLPGIHGHYQWRKRWIESRLPDAFGLRPGLGGQVLIVGAGLGGLGASIANARPDIQVFELDRPALLEIKQESLHHHLGAVPNWYAVAFGQARRRDGSWISCARAHQAWRLDAPTAVVLEGVAMYLPLRAIVGQLRWLHRMTPAATTLLGTAMDLRPDGRPGFHRQSGGVDCWLRSVGEPFHWGLHRSDLCTGLQRMGWEPMEWADPFDAADPDPCPGEHLLACMKTARA